jgi:RNA recognition motif-containing protein
MRIYVGNLSFNTGEAELQALFATKGTVDSVKLVRDQATGRSRGFAFVEMANDQEANAACESFHEQDFEGRRLTVNEAKPQERSGGGGGGYSRGGGFGGQKREARW